MLYGPIPETEEEARVKIKGVEIYLEELGERNMPLVRVLTDEGIHGVGEAFTVGPDLATVKAIEYYAEWLIGPRTPWISKGYGS